MKFSLMASVVFLTLAGISLIGGDIDNARFCTTIMMLWYIVFRFDVLDEKG
jgi:hypothetical protein